MLNFADIKKIHFIGIGGASLSSLASLMRKKQISVSGSDRSYSEKLLTLQEIGCDIWVGCDTNKISDIDLVVFSSAISLDNEELVHCKKLNIPCLERYVFLGEVARLFKNTIAIGGTHGKTTVTGMVIHTMKSANLTFCGHIGGDLQDIGNFYYSGDMYFVTEACEYKKSLLAIKPSIAMVLNAENDHPDTYNCLSEIYDTFDCFLENADFLQITNGDTPYYKSRQSHKKIITFGYNADNQYTISNVKEYKKGYYEFLISHFGMPKCTLQVGIAGKHNIINATACFVICHLLNIPMEKIADSIKTFQGTKRRFQDLGFFMGATVIIDYAHHPSQIEVAINTATNMLTKNAHLYVVFQPHTYSRTAKLFEEFCKSLLPCHELIICKEYKAREHSSSGKSALQLYEKIPHKQKYYYNNIMDIANHLSQKVQVRDIILILGAGNIDNLGNIITYQ